MPLHLTYNLAPAFSDGCAKGSNWDIAFPVIEFGHLLRDLATDHCQSMPHPDISSNTMIGLLHEELFVSLTRSREVNSLPLAFLWLNLGDCP